MKNNFYIQAKAADEWVRSIPVVKDGDKITIYLGEHIQSLSRAEAALLIVNLQNALYGVWESDDLKT